MTYIHIKMRVKPNRRFPELHLGDNVKLYQKMLCDTGHVSKWSHAIFKVTGKPRSNCVVFYNTKARGSGYLRNAILEE